VADYRPASATVEEAETARWVNGMPVPDADKMVRLCERERRKGAMLDLVIADAGDDSYLGEILLFAHEHRQVSQRVTAAGRPPRLEARQEPTANCTVSSETAFSSVA
jgi:hypothetical protein